MTSLLEEQKIEETIKKTESESFSVRDFIQTFKTLFPDDWKRLKERFGEYGEKRKYTINTYLANRLDLYSQKPNSLLDPFRRYSQAKFKDYRKVTDEERRHFGSSWIAIFRKRKHR